MSIVVLVFIELLSLGVTCYSVLDGRQSHEIKRIPSLGCPAANPILEKVNLATPNAAIVDLLCQYAEEMMTCFKANPKLISPLPDVVQKWFFTYMPRLCGQWKEDAKKVGNCVYNYLDLAGLVCDSEPMPSPLTLDSMIDRTASCYSKALNGCYSSSNLRDIIYTFATYWFYNPFH